MFHIIGDFGVENKGIAATEELVEHGEDRPPHSKQEPAVNKAKHRRGYCFIQSLQVLQYMDFL